MSKKEAFYDAEIAPELLRLSKLCEDKGISFLAVVEYAPSEHGRTLSLQAGAGLGIRLADTAARANGNVDLLIMAIMRYAREHGHSSACLHILGVPERPEKETAA